MGNIKIAIPHKVTKEDVWGRFKHSLNTFTEHVDDGMIVARTGDICPIFGDTVPYKSVTIICTLEQELDVLFWIEYVHGSNSVSQRRIIDETKVAIRSDYMCW